MSHIFRLLPVSIITAVMASSASSAFMPHAAPQKPDRPLPVKGFSAGGSSFRSVPWGSRIFLRSVPPIRNNARRESAPHGRSFSGKTMRRPLFALRHVWDGAVPSHIQSHYRHVPDEPGTSASYKDGTHGQSGVNGLPPRPGHLNQTGHLTLASIGSVSHGTYNGHVLAHKVLGYHHSLLTGLHFNKPGSHLHDRLARLRGHHWHKRFRHAVIAGFAGAAACDADCEFDVPDDVYGDFIAAASAEGTVDSEASAQEEAERAGRRSADAHGWNKAVAILEESAGEDDKRAGEAKNSGGAETVFDQPEEQVDISLRGGKRPSAPAL
jgi:hypothetical protein